MSAPCGSSAWCTWEANETCPHYRRFVALGEGEPPIDAEVKPAQELNGRVALVSFFVDRAESHWTDAEICDVFRALETCGHWLAREAARYNVTLKVDSDPLYYHADDPREHLFPIGLSTLASQTVLVEAQGVAEALSLASQWAYGLGFADIVRFVGHVQRSVDADSWVMLFHPREAGRSFAVPACISLHTCVEIVICYPQYATLRTDLVGPMRPDVATYAHELLHLFGATDKYDVTSLDGFAPGSVTERDIMRCGSARLERLRIDPLTAAEIGWPTG